MAMRSWPAPPVETGGFTIALCAMKALLARGPAPGLRVGQQVLDSAKLGYPPEPG
jgi:hypothetical protein